MSQLGLVMPSTEEGKVFRKDAYFEGTGYFPHLAQQEIHYDPTRHRVLSNGRRWGKTLLGGKEAECTAFVRNYLGEPMRGWIIGPEYGDCEKEFRVVYNTFKALGIDDLSHKFLNNVENGSMHISTRWGFDLQCRSAKHPETLVGEGLDFVLMVEAGRLKRRVFTEYVRPALSDKRGWSLMSGVPEIAADFSLLYWGWQRGIEPGRRQWASWQMPSWTNTYAFPGGRNDSEIIEAEDDLTDDEFKRQYGGEFVERYGRVMKEWDDEIHLRDLEYNPRWPLFAALDYGYTNDWVWLWIQTDEWNNVYVIKEHRFRLRDTEEIIRAEFRDNDTNRALVNRVTKIYAPPAEPGDTAIVSRLLGKPCYTNTGGEINPRMALIRQALKQKPKHLPDGHPEKLPGLMVDKTCTQLAWEMREGYRWPETKHEGRNESENPMDVDNHGPEALSRFFKGRMERYTPGRQSRQSKMRVRRR